MIEGLAKQEISKTLGPLVTPERVVLFFLFLVLYSEKSLFTSLSFLDTEVSLVASNAIDSIKATKTWVILFIMVAIFIASPVLTHLTIKKISEISLLHSEALYEKIESEARELSENNQTINELKIEAAENALKLRKESQFISRSTSFIYSTGFCLFLYTEGFGLIIPIIITVSASIICYKASVELIKINYEKVQKYRLAATFKECDTRIERLE